RASVLDGLRIPGDADHPHWRCEALAVVRRSDGCRAGEQALDADLRLRPGCRTDPYAGAPVAALAVVLGRGCHRVSHLPAQPAVEHPEPLSFPGTTSQYPPQRAGRQTPAFGVLRPGDPGDAAVEPADLAGGLVVSVLRQSGKAVSRARLGLGCDGGRDSGAQPSHLLPVRRLPGSVRSRRCGLGTVAGSRPRAVGQAGVCDTDGADRRRTGADAASAAAAGNLRPLRGGHAPAAAASRKPPAWTAAATVRRPVRLGR